MRPAVALTIAAITAFNLVSPARAEIKRYIRVNPMISRGAQPENQADYDLLKAAGVKTLINLRQDSTVATERALARRMGFEFRNYPMNGFSYPRDEIVNGALQDLTNPALQPVFVHCQHGEDRTGLILGLYRYRYEHWASDKSYDEMLSLGFHPELLGLTLYWQNATRAFYGDALQDESW